MFLPCVQGKDCSIHVHREWLIYFFSAKNILFLPCAQTTNCLFSVYKEQFTYLEKNKLSLSFAQRTECFFSAQRTADLFRTSVHSEQSVSFLCIVNKLFLLCTQRTKRSFSVHKEQSVCSLCTRTVDLYRTSLCTKNKVVLLCAQRTKEHTGYFSMHGQQLICFFSVHSCAMRRAKKQFVSNTMSAKRTHFFLVHRDV